MKNVVYNKMEFYRANLLKSHYKNAHNIVIKEEILEFPSYANFLNWKESEEEKTFSYFPKVNREADDRGKLYERFNCQFHGSNSPYGAFEKKGLRKQREKGSVKRNAIF